MSIIWRSGLFLLAASMAAGGLAASADDTPATIDTAAPAHGSSPAGSSQPETEQPPEAKPATAAGKSAVLADLQAKEARGLVSLGLKLTERGDFAAAEIAFRRVMNDRSFPAGEQRDALLGLARMHRQQPAFTKAVAAYEKFLKLHPDDPRVPDALLELGRSQRAMGAYKNAINRFYNVINSTLKLPPESYEHYQLLAKTAQFEIAETYYEVGDFAEAAKFYDRLRLLDLAPEDRARAHFKSAGSLLNAGEYEAAVTKLNQFIEQWPADAHVPESRYLLALTLRRLGRAEEALATTLALLRDEQNNAATDPRGWAYWQRRTGNQLANDFFQNGDTHSAVTIYESLVRLSEDNAWRLPIIYQTGLCYERLRQSERAARAYRTIIESAARPREQTPAAGELVELARMAEWRLGQMDWSDRTERQLEHFFSASTATPARPTPPTTTPANNDPHGSTATTPGAL